MKLIPLSVATAVVAGSLLASPGAASAVQAPGPGPSIVVTDPAGDVLDAGATTRFKARSIDISRAVYSIKNNRNTRGDKTDQVVSFLIEHRRSQIGRGTKPVQRLVVTFTSGDRRYKATTGNSFTYVDSSGRRQDFDGPYGYGAGGGRFEFDVPTNRLPSGSVTDVRATLRVVGSRARDVVAPAPGPLEFDPRR